MKYHVELSSKAFKALTRLDKKSKKRILKKLKTLEGTPFPHGFKKLRGEENTYRLRMGDIRILYKLLKTENVIIVFRIENRNKAYN